MLSPFSALTWEESTTQREQSRREAAFSSASSTSCSRCQTPGLFLSRSRRQHVMPEPKPTFLGQVLPLDTGMQHVQDPAQHSTSRSGNGLRPGYRNLRSRCGSSSSRRSHSSADTIHGDIPTPGRTLNSRPGHGNQDRPTSLDWPLFAQPSRFRGEFYACLAARSDAFFDLPDAVLYGDAQVRWLANRRWWWLVDALRSADGGGWPKQHCRGLPTAGWSWPPSMSPHSRPRLALLDQLRA